jgi:hypothetical protein
VSLDGELTVVVADQPIGIAASEEREMAISASRCANR